MTVAFLCIYAFMYLLLNEWTDLKKTLHEHHHTYSLRVIKIDIHNKILFDH